jgi:hypothetical protein
MRDENSIKTKLSWSKTFVRKWFNIKTKAKDFHSDYAVEEVGVQWRTSFSERDVCKSKKSRTGTFCLPHHSKYCILTSLTFVFE